MSAIIFISCIYYFLFRYNHSMNMFQCITAHNNFIHHDPAAWDLTYVHVELLDGCLDVVDLLS